MTKLCFGNNRSLASVKEAMEAAKAARRERFSHEADKRRRRALRGHRAGVQKLRALWETAVNNRVQEALGQRRYTVNVPAIVRTAKTHKRVVIGSQKAFQAVTHRLTAKQGEMFSVMSLNYNQSTGWFSPMAVKVPVSLETPELEHTVREENSHINSITMMPIERFSRAYINVCCGDNPALLDLLLLDGKIYCVLKVGANGKSVAEDFYVKDVEEGKALNLVTGEPCSFDDFDHENVHVHVYGLLGVSSPGQLKQGEISLYCESLDGFNARKHLNKMTHGMYDLIVKKYAGKQDQLKALAQLSTRISQFKAGMVRTKPIRGIAITMAKIKDELGNDWMDGLQLFSAEGVARAFGDNQFTVLPSAVDGAAAQARPLIVNKGLGLCMPTWCMLVILKSQGCDYEFIAQDELTEEQFEDYQNTVLWGVGPYVGKTLVILPTFKKKNGDVMTDMEKLARVDAWVDLNVHKTVCDIRLPFTGFNVMSFDHGKRTVEEEANTSNQLLSSALFADALRTIAYMKQCAKKEADKIMAKAVNTEGKRLTAKDLLGDLAMASQIAYPEFAVRHWAPYFQDNLNKALEGFGTRLKKLSISTDGIYLKIIPDLAHFFGINLLKYYAEDGTCEMLAPQLSREGINRAIAVKYPKMGTDEFAKVILVSPEELVERARVHLENGDITEEQFAVIEHVLTHLHDGVVMVPAIEELKNMLAGMDFDGDALILYCDETLVEVIWAIKPVATTIMKDKDFAKLQASRCGDDFRNFVKAELSKRR